MLPDDEPEVPPVHGQLQGEGELLQHRVQAHLARDDRVNIHPGQLQLHVGLGGAIASIQSFQMVK